MRKHNISRHHYGTYFVKILADAYCSRLAVILSAFLLVFSHCPASSEEDKAQETAVATASQIPNNLEARLAQCKKDLAAQEGIAAHTQKAYDSCSTQMEEAFGKLKQANAQLKDAQDEVRMLRNRVIELESHPPTSKPGEDLNALQSSLSVALGNLDKEIRALEPPAKGQGE